MDQHKYIEKIKEKIKSPLFTFIFANAMYSFSTWLISILSPFLLEKDTYERFIYSFQTMLYVASVSTLGFVPTLLRYYKYDKQKYQDYFLYCISVIYILLLIVGFFPKNPLSCFLHIEDYSFSAHLVFYLSSITILLFVFNRALLTAEAKYMVLVKTILSICVIRVLAMLFIKAVNITSDAMVMFCICVIPMMWEFLIYGKNVAKIKWYFNYREFKSFIVFAFMTSIIGIIFVTSGRLYLLELKSNNSFNVPIISYVYGMLGIVTIFNTTFSPYFIGKLDARNLHQIDAYIYKIKLFTIPYLLFVVLLTCGIFMFVYLCYPYNSSIAAIYAAVASVSSSLIAYVGLLTLLTKTFNLLKMQLCVNGTCLIVTFLYVRYIPCIDSIYAYVLLVIIQLVFELFVAIFVLYKIKRVKQIQEKSLHGK